MEKSDWSQEYKDTIQTVLVFEIKSLLGRLFKNRQPNLEIGKLLNLGCGTFRYSGFINADFFGGFAFWRRGLVKPDWELDLRFPLNCEDDTWEGVFTEHVIEHLYRDEVVNLFRELFRTMARGATLRIVVPDLEQTATEYLNEAGDEKGGKGARLVWDLSQNWGHRSVWDYALLKDALEETGFSDITKQVFNSGRDGRLIRDSVHRAERSLYCEAVKL